MIRVLIVDDHPIVRTGIRGILAQANDIVVVGEADDGDDGLRQAAELQPHVVLLDISMPGISGVEVLRQLKTQAPQAGALMLSMHPEEQYAVRLLRAGARGYVAKDAPPADLIAAVRKVHDGGRYISAAVAERLAFNLDSNFEGPPHEKLSSRELDVMRHLAGGKTVSDIGRQLGLSVKTVSTYRRRILEKMALGSTAEIIRYAVDHQLVE